MRGLIESSQGDLGEAATAELATISDLDGKHTHTHQGKSMGFGVLHKLKHKYQHSH